MSNLLQFFWLYSLGQVLVEAGSLQGARHLQTSSYCTYTDLHADVCCTQSGSVRCGLCPGECSLGESLTKVCGANTCSDSITCEDFPLTVKTPRDPIDLPIGSGVQVVTADSQPAFENQYHDRCPAYNCFIEKFDGSNWVASSTDAAIATDSYGLLSIDTGLYSSDTSYQVRQTCSHHAGTFTSETLTINIKCDSSTVVTTVVATIANIKRDQYYSEFTANGWPSNYFGERNYDMYRLFNINKHQCTFPNCFLVGTTTAGDCDTDGVTTNTLANSEMIKKSTMVFDMRWGSSIPIEIQQCIACNAAHDPTVFYTLGPSTYTILSYCHYNLMFTLYDFTQVKQVPAVAGQTVYEIFSSYSEYLTTNETTQCPIDGFQLVYPDGTLYTGTEASIDSAGRYVDTRPDANVAQIKIRALSNTHAGNYKDSPTLSYQVICSSSQPVAVTRPTQIPSTGTWSKEIDGTQDKIILDEFTLNIPQCQIDHYKIHALGGTLNSDFVNPVAVSSGKLTIQLASNRVWTKGDFVFKIKLVLNSGEEKWATWDDTAATKEEFRLSMVCGASSTVVGIDTSDPTKAWMTQDQWVDVGKTSSDPDMTAFTIPLISNSNDANCPITQMRVSSLSSSVTAIPTLPDPISDVGSPNPLHYKVVPSDINLHQSFNFYYKAIAEGGASYTSGEMNLYIGCHFAFISGYVSDSAATLQQMVALGVSTSKVFTIVNPTSTFPKSYCSPVSNHIMAQTVIYNPSGSVPAAPLSLSAACGGTQPCTWLDASSTTLPFQVTFFIRTYYTGSVAYFDSSTFQLTVGCTPFMATLTWTAVAPSSFSFISDEAAPIQLAIPKANCMMSATCCPTITYTVSLDQSIISQASSFTVPVLDTTASSSTFDEVIAAPTDPSLSLTSSVWIQAKTVYGAILSPEITFSVQTRGQWCVLNDQITQLTSLPTEGDFFDRYLIPENSSSPILNMRFVKGEFGSPLDIDLSSRFTNTKPAECPITEYELVKVVEYEELDNGVSKEIELIEAQYQKYLTFNPTSGILSFLETSSITPRLRVYARAKTDHNTILGVGSPLVDFEVMEEEVVESSNFPPGFATSLEPFKVTLQRGWNGKIENQELKYQFTLPEVIEPNKENWTASADSPEDFIQFDSSGMTFSIDLTSHDLSSSFTTEVALVLKDEAGNKNEYTVVFQVEIEAFSLTIEEGNFQTPDGSTAEIPTAPVGPASETKDQEVKIMPAKAWIETISAFGDVEIRFNHPMRGGEPSSVDSSSIHLQLVVAENRNEIEGFNSSSIEFSWNTTEFSEDKLLLKLAFSSPEHISPLLKQDELVIEILEPIPLFLLRNENRAIETRRLTAPVRKQIKDDEATRAFSSRTEAAETTMRILFLASLGLNLLLSGGMKYMVGMIRSLQLVIHLPIFMVIMPSNVMIFFQTIIPFVLFDILENDQGIGPQMLLSFDDEAQSEIEGDIFDQMKDLGYESHNFIGNLNSMAFFLMVYFIEVAVAIIIKLIANMTGGEKWKLQARYERMSKRLFFAELISMFIEGYLEFLIAGYLCLRSQITSGSGEVASMILSYFSVPFAVLGLPAALVWIMIKKKGGEAKTANPDFEEKWGELYADLRPRQSSLAFNFCFLLRRLAFVALAFGLLNPVLQIICLVLLSLASLILLGSVRPRLSRFDNSIEIMNEYLLLIATLHLLFFTDYIADPSLQLELGWSLISVCILKMALNLSVVIYFSYRQLALARKKYAYKFTKWQERLGLPASKKKRAQKEDELLESPSLSSLSSAPIEYFGSSKSSSNDEEDGVSAIQTPVVRSPVAGKSSIKAFCGPSCRGSSSMSLACRQTCQAADLNSFFKGSKSSKEIKKLDSSEVNRMRSGLSKGNRQESLHLDEQESELEEELQTEDIDLEQRSPSEKNHQQASRLIIDLGGRTSGRSGLEPLKQQETPLSQHFMHKGVFFGESGTSREEIGDPKEGGEPKSSDKLRKNPKPRSKSKGPLSTALQQASKTQKSPRRKKTPQTRPGAVQSSSPPAAKPTPEKKLKPTKTKKKKVKAKKNPRMASPEFGSGVEVELSEIVPQPLRNTLSNTQALPSTVVQSAIGRKSPKRSPRKGSPKNKVSSQSKSPPRQAQPQSPSRGTSPEGHLQPLRDDPPSKMTKWKRKKASSVKKLKKNGGLKQATKATEIKPAEEPMPQPSSITRPALPELGSPLC